MAVPTGRFDKVDAGKLDTSKFTPDTRSIQAIWIRRRFGLAPQRAALVAALALGGAA